jgi:hypothetical protein
MWYSGAQAIVQDTHLPFTDQEEERDALLRALTEHVDEPVESIRAETSQAYARQHCADAATSNKCTNWASSMPRSSSP